MVVAPLVTGGSGSTKLGFAGGKVSDALFDSAARAVPSLSTFGENDDTPALRSWLSGFLNS